MFPMINIFGRYIGSYAVFAFIGLITCGFAVYFACKNLKISFEDVVILILIVSAGLIIGGHLFYGAVNLPQLISYLYNDNELNIKSLFSALTDVFGGMVFYGGFIGGLISLKIYAMFSKLPFKNRFLDIYAFSIPLFHFFGRIGCFFAGCCYGIESRFGFTVTDNPLVPDINGVNRLPIALIEAFLNLIIFIVLLTLFRKSKFKFNLIYLYMLIYPIVRFVTEFFRGDEIRGIFFGLSTSQWISVILICIAVCRLFKYNHDYRLSR